MKKITKKLQKFVNSISNVGESSIPEDEGKIYYSKIDGSYLTRVGMEGDLDYLLRLGVTEQLQNCNNTEGNSINIGFNPLEQKWYGWSHRAIFGFGIGSKCKKGSCGYSASNKEDFTEASLKWYGDTDMDETYKINASTKEVTQEGLLGCLVGYQYSNDTPNKKMRGTTQTNFEPYPETWGKGEWTAKTLEEAKEMAINFAQGVS